MTLTAWLLPGAVAAASVLAEVGARHWIRRFGGYYVWPRWYRRIIRLDPALGPRLEPRVRMEVNSDGERGAECPRGTLGVYRVLVAGASSVECAFVDQPSSWPVRLEAFLSRPECLRRLGALRVHVGNVGRSGMDVRAVDLILERVLPRYARLDLIGIMVGTADVLRWIESGASPLVPVEPLPPDVCFEEHPLRVFGWRLRSLAMVRLLSRLRRRLLRPVDRRSGSGKWLVRARAMRQRAREVRTSVPDPTLMLNTFEHYLRSVVRRSREVAPRVMLLRQPSFRKPQFSTAETELFWVGGIGSAYRGDDVTVYFSNDVLLSLFDLVDARVRLVAEELGVEYVDATQGLEVSARTFSDQIHLTAAGSGVLAEAIARAVVRNEHAAGGGTAPPA